MKKQKNKDVKVTLTLRATVSQVSAWGTKSIKEGAPLKEWILDKLTLAAGDEYLGEPTPEKVNREWVDKDAVAALLKIALNEMQLRWASSWEGRLSELLGGERGAVALGRDMQRMTPKCLGGAAWEYRGCNVRKPWLIYKVDQEGNRMF